jgi:hypothetical protein
VDLARRLHHDATHSSAPAVNWERRDERIM